MSIDPSSLGFLRAAGRTEAVGWFAGADLMFPNEEEQEFLDLDVERSVRTLGADGARFGGRKISARDVDVLDTTGAGDAFCAGFLSVWVDRWDAEAALDAGARAAARCVVRRGARP